MEASPFKIDGIHPGAACFSSQAGAWISPPRPRQQAHHLAGPGFRLVKGLPKSGHRVLSAHESGQALGHRGLDPGLHLTGLDELKGLLGLLLCPSPQSCPGTRTQRNPWPAGGYCSETRIGAGSGHALHPGGQVRGVADGGVIHPEIVPDGAHDHRAGVEPDPHLELYPRVLLYLLTVFPDGLLNRQGRMAGPLGMVFMGHRSTEQGHHPIAGELVDRALIPVDLIHQDLESTRP